MKGTPGLCSSFSAGLAVPGLARQDTTAQQLLWLGGHSSACPAWHLEKSGGTSGAPLDTMGDKEQEKHLSKHHTPLHPTEGCICPLPSHPQGQTGSAAASFFFLLQHLLKGQLSYLSDPL